jgi:hypothetical protein
MDHFSVIKMVSALLIFSGVYLVTRSKARPEWGNEVIGKSGDVKL